MKPTLQNLTTKGHRGASPSLKMDYHFQPNNAADFAGRCHGSPRPSFRNISKDYFNTEAPAHFLGEVVVFTLIVAAAAGPMIAGLRGVAHLVRGFGIL